MKKRNLLFSRLFSTIFVSVGIMISDVSKMNAESFQEKVDNLFFRGYQKLENGNIKSAIVDFTEVIELDPGYARAYFERAFATSYLKGNSKKLIQKANADYSKFIELKPYDPNGYFNRGLGRSFLKDDIGALQDFNKSIELDSRYDAAYYFRGYTKNLLNDDGACKDFLQSLSLGFQITDRKVNRWVEKNCY